MSDLRLAPAATVVVVTPEQLEELVRNAVAAALMEHHQEAAPALLDRSGIARALSVGTGTVARLRREGMPCVMIGDSPRFLLGSCVEWLQRRRVAATP